jgi:hypothetical protein
MLAVAMEESGDECGIIQGIYRRLTGLLSDMQD